MIGLVVTGHESFATGVSSALALLAGELQDVSVVDFPGTQPAEELGVNLTTAVDAFEEADGVLVCADVLGGSPFKAAAILAAERPGVRVVSGTNLPLLIEAYMAHGTAVDIDAFARQVVETARMSTSLYEPAPYVEETEEDGI